MSSSARPRHARIPLTATTLAGALALLLACVAVAAETRTVSFVSAGGSGPFEAEYVDSSADGARIWFDTEEALVPADDNEAVDTYQWSDGLSTLVATAGDGTATESGARFAGESADGSRLFFETKDALLPGDNDESSDVYERVGETLALVSVGPDGGDAELSASANFVSADGTRVIFQTDESLVAADEDASRDLYERVGGVTTLVSTSPTDPSSEALVLFAAATENGSTFFRTPEQLDPEDEDTYEDLYERKGGVTTRHSLGPTGGNGNFTASGPRVSADGSRVFFETFEPLVEADDDGQRDAYERHEGETTLVTTGSAGNAGQSGFLSRISPDGLRALFYTYGALEPADTDTSQDVYLRAGGETTLVSSGPVGGDGGFDASPVALAEAADRVFFRTEEALTADDTDEARDIYEFSAGTTTLVSTGPAGGNGPLPASFGAVSADGSRVYFQTSEALVAADADEAQDVYERSAGVTTLISTGPDDAESGGGSYLEELSDDGQRAVFYSYESLLAADADEEADLYVSALDPAPPVTPPAAAPPVAAPVASSLPPAARTHRCMGKKATIVGSGKRDVLRGTGKRDVIVAFGGNDEILARGGNDIVCAGAGKDTVLAGAGNDKVAGQGGRDRLFGQAGLDRLFGNNGNDLLNGGAKKDRCRGGKGRDRLRKCER